MGAPVQAVTSYGWPLMPSGPPPQALTHTVHLQAPKPAVAWPVSPNTPVCHDATDGRQHEGGQEANEHDRRDGQAAAAGEFLHQRERCHVAQPAADVVHHLGGPQEPEVAVLPQDAVVVGKALRARLLGGHGCGGGGGGSGGGCGGSRAIAIALHSVTTSHDGLHGDCLKVLKGSRGSQAAPPGAESAPTAANGSTAPRSTMCYEPIACRRCRELHTRRPAAGCAAHSPG